MNPRAYHAIEAARVAEGNQARFYRALAAAAEERGDRALAERLHGLHADEQHHLSRLTARLIDEGKTPAELPGATPIAADLDDWEERARGREAHEIGRYEWLLECELDDQTRTLITSILDVERHHAEELGGKWTIA